MTWYWTGLVSSEWENPANWNSEFGGGGSNPDGAPWTSPEWGFGYLAEDSLADAESTYSYPVIGGGTFIMGEGECSMNYITNYGSIGIPEGIGSQWFSGLNFNNQGNIYRGQFTGAYFTNNGTVWNPNPGCPSVFPDGAVNNGSIYGGNWGALQNYGNIYAGNFATGTVNSGSVLDGEFAGLLYNQSFFYNGNCEEVSNTANFWGGTANTITNNVTIIAGVFKNVIEDGYMGQAAGFIVTESYTYWGGEMLGCFYLPVGSTISLNGKTFDGAFTEAPGGTGSYPGQFMPLITPAGGSTFDVLGAGFT